MKLHQLFEAKVTAAQKREIEKLISRAKYDSHITFAEIEQAEEDAFDTPTHAVHEAVMHALWKWADVNKAEYERITALVEKTWPTAGLVDTGVDRENTLVDGRTENSVDYWASLLSATKNRIRIAAKELGIDVSAVVNE